MLKRLLGRRYTASSAVANPILRWPPPPPSPPNPPLNSLDAGTATPARHRCAAQTLALPPGSDPSSTTALVDRLAKSRAFDSAWSLLLRSPGPHPVAAFAALIRRYARAAMPHDAVRAYDFLRDNPHLVSTADEQPDPFELLLDALCKEGHARVAADCLARRRTTEPPGWSPSVRCYNILLHGWFRARRPRKAERLWAEMQRDGVTPTVVTYGTLIEGLCHSRRPNDALTLFDEMRASGLDANHLTCNPIVDSLAEAGRFKEAMGLVEKYPLFGISPNISTYNSLVKGFCKNKDLVGASKILKTMIGRGVLPTAMTYNYFFLFFAKYGKIEEGMNLHTKMIESGYSLDRVTYQLLIKMLCEKDKVELVVQMIKEMNKSGFQSDLATCTMLVHMLCRLRRYEEACAEFESMIKRGIVPQFITYHKLVDELRRLGLVDMVKKISDLMDSVPHSTKLPGTYRVREGDEIVKLRESIMKKALVMSEALKACKDPEERSKLKSSDERCGVC